MHYTRESLQALKDLVDPIDILNSFCSISSSDISDTGNEIRCPCPLHHGDNNSAFSWKRDTGTWTCFSHGCGNNSKSKDIYSFVCLKLNLTFKEAVERIAELVNFQLEEGTSERDEGKSGLMKNLKSLNKFNRNIDNVELTYLPGYDPSFYGIVEKYIKARGFDPEVIKEFNLYPRMDDTILRMGIPIYDQNGILVGVNARLMDKVLSYPEKVIREDGKEVTIPKYKMSKNSKASLVLYNLNKAKYHSASDGLIVVEGQTDAIRLHTYGMKNAVCCCGTSLTKQQALLIHSHCYQVTFLIEEGEPAWKGVSASLKHLATNMVKVYIAPLKSGDADSNSYEEVCEALDNRRLLSYDEINQILNQEKRLLDFYA